MPRSLPAALSLLLLLAAFLSRSRTEHSAAALSPAGHPLGVTARVTVIPSTVPRGGRMTVVADHLPLSSAIPSAGQYCVYFNSPLGVRPLARFIPGGPGDVASPLAEGSRPDVGVGTYQTWAGVDGSFQLSVAPCASGAQPRALRPVARTRFTVNGERGGDVILPAGRVWGDTPLGKPFTLSLLGPAVPRCIITLPDAPVPMLRLPSPVFIPSGGKSATLTIPRSNPWGFYQLVLTRAAGTGCPRSQLAMGSVLGSTAWYPGPWSLRMDIQGEAQAGDRLTVHLNRNAGPFDHKQPVCLAAWYGGHLLQDRTYGAAQVGFDAVLRFPLPSGVSGAVVLTATLGACPASGPPASADAYITAVVAAVGASAPTPTPFPTPTPRPTAPMPTLEPPAAHAAMQLRFSTFLGSNWTASGAAVFGNGSLTVGPDGVIRVIGWAGPDPHRPPAGLLRHQGAFLLTFAPHGSALRTERHFPGWLAGSAIDGQGNIYVLGWVETQHIQPVNAFQPANRSHCFANGRRFPCAQAYVTKLSPSGAVLYSTYLGGSRDNFPAGIAVDLAGNAYIAGTTDSEDFPTRAAAQSRYAGPHAASPSQLPAGDFGMPYGDAFVTRLDPSGRPVYSTYLGGSDDDVASGIAVDGAGNAYLTGWTASTDFPTKHALQPRPAGTACIVGPVNAPTRHVPCADAFVAKLDAAGALQYSTYLGGSLNEHPNAIAVDAAGDATIVGTTTSKDFPTLHPIQSHYHPGTCQGEDEPYACADAFITTLSPGGDRILHSTYYGGSGDDNATAITVDQAGTIYVTGSTTSPDLILRNPLWRSHVGGQCGRNPCANAFVLAILPSGALSFATYLGGSPGDAGQGGDTGTGIAVRNGELYLSGTTGSRNFPALHPLQPALTGLEDLFLTELDAPSIPIPSATRPTGP